MVKRLKIYQKNVKISYTVLTHLMLIFAKTVFIYINKARRQGIAHQQQQNFHQYIHPNQDGQNHVFLTF